MKFRPFLSIAVAAALLPVPGRSAPVSLLEPAGDRWMYWAGDFDGLRPSASVYGAYGPYDFISQGYDFDDRHAQFFLDFDTTDIAPAGQGPENYQISSLQVRLLVNEDEQFIYDPTHDPLGTYTGAEQDTSPGRPIELFGVGYRGGFTRETFRENSPYVSGNVTQENGVWIVKSRRNAYAMDFINGQPRDVSNNVEEDFEVRPWAIGQIPGVADLDGELDTSVVVQPGQSVPFEAIMTFTIDLSDPLIRAYVQEGLHAGRLHFMVTSLKEYVYTGDQGASGGFPSFYTKENSEHRPLFGVNLAPRLTADVAVSSGPAAVHRPVPSIDRAPGSGFRISFATETGHSYQVQYRSSLNETAATNLGPAIAGDGTVRFVDDPTQPGAAVPRRFYHISVTKIPDL